MAQRGKPKKLEESKQNESYLERVNHEVSSNQSKLNMILGALIVLVVGILIFNYFNRNKPDLGPAQTTTEEQQDANPNQLPGKYTVKEGDTLFTIAEKYYQDGSKFEDLAKANNLTDVDAITAGQVLEIPKLEIASLPNPSETPSPSPSPEITTPNTTDNTTADAQWGPKITGNTYTVQEGDWLSIIAGRAYGDIFTYQKIAEANNISNPDLIYPGQVLTIPR